MDNKPISKDLWELFSVVQLRLPAETRGFRRDGGRPSGCGFRWNEVKRPSGLGFLAPQSSEICDKRSLDFRHFSWSGIYDFRHSLGVELRQIFGILLSGIYGSRFLAFS
ncbi:unnamed protein product [Rhizophagus irregularis]|nr:unnamed protein product [Rhizophagus irregularis]